MNSRSFFFVTGVLVGAGCMLLLVRIGLVPQTLDPAPIGVFGLLLIASWLLGRFTKPAKRLPRVSDQSSTAIHELPRRSRNERDEA